MSVPILPTPVEDRIRHIKSSVLQGVRLLFSHSTLMLLGLGTWGVLLVDDFIDSLTFVTTIVSWVLGAAFFGVAAQMRSPKKPRVTWKLIWASIRRLTIGNVVITMVFSLPVLLIVPVLNELFSLGLQGSRWVLIFFVGPTVVPAVAAMWSLAWKRSGLAQAAADGVLALRGRWVPALLVGAVYQAVALGSQSLRIWLTQHDVLLTVTVGVVWVVIEALFRLTVFMWLFEAAPPAEKKNKAGPKG